MKIGIIGVGKMGKAFINAFLENSKKTKIRKKNLVLYDLIIDEMHGKDFYISESVMDLVETVDIILLAIKPQNLDTVLEEIRKSSFSDKLIVSIVAGATINKIQEYLSEVDILRLMPNIAINISMGTTVYTPKVKREFKKLTFFMNALRVVSTVVEVEEKWLNEVIPLMSSLPAFVYYFAKSLIDNAVDHGFDRVKAYNLVVETIIEAGCLMSDAIDENTSLERLINDVAVPGGTTEAGLNSLKNDNFGNILKKCANQTIKKAFEL